MLVRPVIPNNHYLPSYCECLRNGDCEKRTDAAAVISGNGQQQFHGVLVRRTREGCNGTLDPVG